MFSYSRCNPCRILELFTTIAYKLLLRMCLLRDLDKIIWVGWMDYHCSELLTSLLRQTFLFLSITVVDYGFTVTDIQVILW